MAASDAAGSPPLTAEGLTARLRRCTESAGLAWPQPRWAVALSGGPDSLALTRLAQEAAQQNGAVLHSYHVDHRLRAESASEAAALAARMAQRGITHRTLVWSHGAVDGNLPAAARAARYDLLTQACREDGVPLLLLAHHADDQAETLLHQLLRGSGVDGLSAMPPARMQDGIAMLRPLLDCTKAALEAVCEAFGETWLKDPGNDDPRFARTLLRRLLREFSGSGLSAARLAETAGHMARARQALEAMTEALLQQADLHAGQASLPLPAWRAAPEEIRLRALRSLAIRLGHGAPPRFASLARLAAALARTESGAMTLHRLQWVWKEDRLLVRAEGAGRTLQPPAPPPI